MDPPLHDVADLLGGTFPGHTMQRLRTPDGKYRYSYVSSGLKESFGLDPAELMRMREVDHAWIHPQDRGRFVAALEHSAATLEQLDEEVRVASETGYKWVRSIGRPRRLEDGTVIWDGVALDVTDRREALQALERTLSQVRENETSEGRFSYIAASDVRERLGDLRQAVAAIRGLKGDRETEAAIAALDLAFRQFEGALSAARDLVQAGGAVTRSAKVEAAAIEGLTRRQREIMDLVVRGNSNREIADSLDIAEGTVKLHISAILKRLDAQNRTQAAQIWSSSAGLGQARKPSA